MALTAPMGLAARWLVPQFSGFVTQHPEVGLRVHASGIVIDPYGGSADPAAHYGSMRATGGGLATEHLFDGAYAPVCHPGPSVRSHDDPTRVPLIHSGQQRTLLQAIGWPMRARTAGTDYMFKTDTGIMFSGDGHATSVVMAGQGVILTNLPLVRDALEASMPVQPFVAPVIQRYASWVVASSVWLENAVVRAVQDWLCVCRKNMARVHRSAQ